MLVDLFELVLGPVDKVLKIILTCVALVLLGWLILKSGVSLPAVSQQVQGGS